MARLDNSLVEKGFFKTRTKAQEAIASGKIYCDGKKIEKSSYNVNEETVIEIRGEVLAYVSRGALKLESAAKNFSIDFTNKTVLDIGSSTGGFTDYVLQHGAAKVVAVDVGTDQMDKDLRLNPKIELHEKTDFRTVADEIVARAEFACIDVSFISVEKILPRLFSIKSVKEVVCLIKPQFECSKEVAAKYKGVVLNKEIHHEVIEKIVKLFEADNMGCLGVIFSPITGGSGNIEYLAYFKKNYNSKHLYINLAIEHGFENLVKENKEDFKIVREEIGRVKRKEGLYLLDIPSKGRGLFCSQDIKEGEVIEISPNIIFIKQEIMETDLKNYVFEAAKLSKSQMAVLKIKNPEEAVMLPTGLILFCNNSNNPNADHYRIEELYTVYFELRAIRDIPKNTEICISYGEMWFEKRRFFDRHNNT